MIKSIKKILKFTVTFLFLFGIMEGAEMKNNILDKKQQEVVAISAFTASGDLERLKVSLNDGLNAGLTVNEIKEVLVQMYAYCGFPRSLNGIGTFMTVLSEREAQGIKDEIGKESSPIPADRNSIEYGTEVQTYIAGGAVKGGMYDFAPAIDEYLKGHLFGDIFGRDALDYKTREIATIAALANIKGVNPQLMAHFNIGMNVGLTREQVQSIVYTIDEKVGNAEGENAQQVLNEVFKNRK